LLTLLDYYSYLLCPCFSKNHLLGGIGTSQPHGSISSIIQGFNSALCGSSPSVDLRVVVWMWLILCGARGLENAPCSLESLDVLAMWLLPGSARSRGSSENNHIFKFSASVQGCKVENFWLILETSFDKRKMSSGKKIACYGGGVWRFWETKLEAAKLLLAVETRNYQYAICGENLVRSMR